MNASFERRDLGLAAATGGELDAARIGIAGDEPVFVDWHCYDLDFELFYVLAGELTVSNMRGESHTLGPGGCGFHPGFYWHRSQMSPDFECVLVKGPAEGAAFDDPGAPLPAKADALDPERSGVYTHDDGSAYTRRPGAFFRARDLGAAAATDGRLGATVYVADEPAHGGDWHSHSSLQWIFVLDGETELALDGGPSERIGRGGAVLIPPRARHAQGEITAGYAQLSLMLPAAFETFDET